MNLEQIIKELNLTALSRQKDFAAIIPESVYTSDLLSCVIAGAKRHSVWITLQAHINIVAVAALGELSAVIISEGAKPDPSTIEKANDQGVILLSSNQPSFAVAGRLWELGLRAN